MGWQEQQRRDELERKRVSAGIRAACPRMSSVWTSLMTDRYEVSSAERSARLESSEIPNEPDRDYVAIMDHVCPGWSDVRERSGKVAAESRARMIWDACKFSEPALYHGTAPGQELAPGERHLSWHFDFAVFKYLQEHGVSDDVAAKVVRRLGIVEPLDRPPPFEE